MSTRPSIAIIIPTLNEAARIERCLVDAIAQPAIAEVVVVDGASSDDTVARAARVSGVRVLSSRRGRGTQLNAGAAAATADVLLFLHADVTLPPDAATHVQRALEAPGAVAGAFRTRTVADGRRNTLGPLLRLADLRSRCTGLPYGDQAVFVRADVFREVGGFADAPLMEDLDLAARLRTRGRVVTVPACVTVSGRRFLADPVRAVVTMNLFPVLFRLGVSPHRLARHYSAPR